MPNDHSTRPSGDTAAPKPTAPTSPPPAPAEASAPHGAIAVIALATGALVANIYYAQPLTAAIGTDLGIGTGLAGAIPGITQLGYGTGLLGLVSLADLVNNKRLVLVTQALVTLALAAATFAASAPVFFLASFFVGFFSAGAHVLVPFVARLVPAAQRGRVVGNVMAGLTCGILLARPVALLMADRLGWRSVFALSTLLMIAIGLLLFARMPRLPVHPSGRSYLQNLGSMASLLKLTPALQRRSLYQTLMFAVFSMFWTAVPTLLAEEYGLGGTAIAVFALTGIGSVLSAPVTGRLADRGYLRLPTAIGMAVLGLGMFASGLVSGPRAVILLAVLATLISAATQMTQAVSQRIIFGCSEEERGRVNAIFMTIVFVGGAIGSVMGPLLYRGGGWTAVAVTGGAIGLLLILIAEGRPGRRDGPAAHRSET